MEVQAREREVRRRKALERAAELAENIERGLSNPDPTNPLAYIVARASREAHDALYELAATSPSDTETIARLQNNVHRLSDLQRWIREAAALGLEAWKEMALQDRMGLQSFLDGVADHYGGDED